MNVRLMLGAALALVCVFTGAACSKAPSPKTTPQSGSRLGPTTAPKPPRRAGPVPGHWRPVGPGKVGTTYPMPRRTAKRVRRRGKPWLGVWLGKDRQPGILLKRVFPGSPAAKSGLKAGDRVIDVDGVPILSVRALQRYVALQTPGDKIHVRLQRAGTALTIGVTLRTQPTYKQRVRDHVIGKPAPAFSVQRVGGGKGGFITHQTLRGKVWILEFWATWCGACVRSGIPMLKRVYSQLKPRGLEILAIAKDKAARVNAFLAKKPLPYLVGLDPRGKVMGAYLINPIPAFMLVDRRGIVREVAVGRTWVRDFGRLVRKASQLLAGGASPQRRPSF